MKQRPVSISRSSITIAGRTPHLEVFEPKRSGLHDSPTYVNLPTGYICLETNVSVDTYPMREGRAIRLPSPLGKFG